VLSARMPGRAPRMPGRVVPARRAARGIGGMAAVPEADGTRFAFLGGLRLPGMRLLDPVLRPAARPSSPSRCVPSGSSSTGSSPANRGRPRPPGTVTG
jgi:hypothetical protein